MIILIHGEDVAASRKLYIQQKSQDAQPITFEGETITLTDLVQLFEGGGLFDSPTTVYIENLLAKRKSSKEVEAIQDYIKEQKNTVVLWEGKEIPKKTITALGTVTDKNCKYPQTLFQFLDSLAPGNTKTMVTYFHAAAETIELEILSFMLIRHFRLLLAIDKESSQQIDEVARLAPWQRGKLQKQARLFSQDSLINQYKKMFAIDVAQKTGRGVLPLGQAIDFFLLEL